MAEEIGAINLLLQELRSKLQAAIDEDFEIILDEVEQAVQNVLTEFIEVTEEAVTLLDAENRKLFDDISHEVQSELEGFERSMSQEHVLETQTMIYSQLQHTAVEIQGTLRSATEQLADFKVGSFTKVSASLARVDAIGERWRTHVTEIREVFSVIGNDVQSLEREVTRLISNVKNGQESTGTAMSSVAETFENVKQILTDVN